MKNLDFQKLIRINQTQLDPGETQWLVQLGANDGVICEGYGLRSILLGQQHNAILVEPLPEVFERCKENYKDANSKLYFENIAIVPSKTNEYEKIYHNGDHEAEPGVQSSFVRYEPHEKFDLVKVEEFKYLVEKYKLTKIHGLFIDIEGLEHDVLDNIFKTINIPISFIRYEFPHVKDPEALDDMLRDYGFKIYACPHGDGDKVAISNEFKEVE
jgi:FkbM family methyltransferase